MENPRPPVSDSSAPPSPSAPPSFSAPAELSGRRRALLGIAATAGGAGTVAAAGAFVGAMRPSRKTQAAGAPVSVNVAHLQPGQLHTVVWRLKPVWILRRSPEMIAGLSELPGLSDPASESSLQPDYCQNPTRSIKPEFLVVVGLCTHLGCLPAQGDGVFLCACHGSRFDFAGRVFAGSPAPSNLIVPPHRYAADNEIIIGEDPA